MSDRWKFVASFDRERAQRLVAFDTFEKVLGVVTASLDIIGGWVCPAADLGHDNCWRPTVSFAVSPGAFDAFFNSPGGYRAQFLSSPESGQAAKHDPSSP